MPPAARVTRDMIVGAGLAVVRREGAEALNVRRVAAELGCSTQPVMYHFRTMEELRQEVYAAADALHTQALMQEGEGDVDSPMLAIGLNYLRFAREEPRLFRFLFQTDQFRGQSLGDLLAGPAIAPFTEPLARESGLPLPRAETVFRGLFAAVHGLASLLANNAMAWDEAACTDLLTTLFDALINQAKEA